MKFFIDYNNEIEHRVLLYNIQEFSFNTSPRVKEINFDIIVNKLNLTVVGKENKIVQVWGFCGFKEWIKSTYKVPKSKKGLLKVVDVLEFGFSYTVTKEDFPMYVNPKTGWICVGSPEKSGKAVEFIENCVAVIDDNKEFVSLWLKPTSLPARYRC